MATARVGTRLTSPESLKSSINAGPFPVLHAHQLRNPGPRHPLNAYIKGGKFAPVVLYRGIADVDGVACLVGHDVEYGKERVTPVDTLAKVEVKAKRYVEVPVDLVRTVTLPARVTEVKVDAPAE